MWLVVRYHLKECVHVEYGGTAGKGERLSHRYEVFCILLTKMYKTLLTCWQHSINNDSDSRNYISDFMLSENNAIRLKNKPFESLQ